MRQQRLGRQAAIDWPLRRGCLHDSAFARPACSATRLMAGQRQPDGRPLRMIMMA
jgi:hypothetical protein